jgi:alkanesulfonate monooxygenase SsuD/methylene tetrahydromethanopterin reductase-like flavin-dependent oxidoreductase (luciferase family)
MLSWWLLHKILCKCILKIVNNGSKVMQEAEKDMQVIHPWVAEGLQKVRVGVAFMGPCFDWKAYQHRVQIAEQLGFDSYWAADHPTMLTDCWVLLAALAATTHRIRLGTIVDCVFYRNPVLLARMAADVDRVSGGRLILGLGIGDQPPEFAKMGMAFPSVRERQEVLEETIEVVKGVWGSVPFTYKKKHVQIEECYLPAGPIQQPHVPLLIAGGGERVTLRQVAQYADASNFGAHPHTGDASSIEDVVRKCNALRAHCERLARPTDAVLRTHITLPLVIGETQAAIATQQGKAPPFLREMFLSSEVSLTPSEAIVYYNALIEAGIQYFIIVCWPDDLNTPRLFSEKVMSGLIKAPDA